MNTVKIYKITITKAIQMSEQGEGYSLEPWFEGFNCEFQGYDDGGKEYQLPEGYEVAMCKSGTLEIYNSKGEHCHLGKKFRSPAIYDFYNQIMLAEVKE